jgi:tRNA(adenine34) deaminase
MPMPDYNQQIDFMQHALNEARAAAKSGEVPVGAVVVYNDRIIGRGSNGCERLQDPTAHAEMIAITAATETLGSWRLENCDIYVTLEPCPMCIGACLNARIRSVYFGATEPKAGACGSVINLAAIETYNHMLQVEGGILADESSALLKAFFKQLRDEKKRGTQK